MQALPTIPEMTLLPGPFILLLLLPAFPLLLFSLGARPPDTSNLPFSTNDIFATSAFISVAGAVVLALGVWPEAGKEVWGWVRQGAEGWESYTLSQTKDQQNDVSGKVVRSSRNFPLAQAKTQMMYNGGRWIQVQMPSPPKVLPISPQISALRVAFPWYSPSRPRLIDGLLVIVLSVSLLTVIAGQLIGKGYDVKSSSSSSSSSSKSESKSSGKLPSWVEREIRYREKEKGKEDETKKRIKKEEKEEEEKKSKKKKEGKEDKKKRVDKRIKEKEILIEELEKRKLPLIGLKDVKTKKNKDDRDQDRDKDKKKEKGKENNQDKEQGGDDSKKAKEREKEKEKGTVNRLANALSRTKRKEQEGKKEPVTATATTGPGWEMADPALAQHTLNHSESNAAKEARRLKAG